MNSQNKDRVSNSSDFDNGDDDTLQARFARLRGHTDPASTFALAVSPPLSSVKSSSSNWLNDERGAHNYSNMLSTNDNKEEEEEDDDNEDSFTQVSRLETTTTSSISDTTIPNPSSSSIRKQQQPHFPPPPPHQVPVAHRPPPAPRRQLPPAPAPAPQTHRTNPRAHSSQPQFRRLVAEEVVKAYILSNTSQHGTYAGRGSPSRSEIVCIHQSPTNLSSSSSS